MAENLPVNFPIPGESVIATYQYVDIANGIGVTEFNGFATQSSGALYSYALTSNSVEGDPIQTAVVNTGGATTLNFDTAFNSPRTIKGNVIVNFTLGEVDDGGSCHAVVTLYKGVDGSYTSLGTATCSQFAGTDAQTNYYRKSLRIPVAETSFKKGDVLRATFVFNVYYVTGNHTSQLHYNPANATLTSTGGTTYNSSLKLHVPFKLDL